MKNYYIIIKGVKKLNTLEINSLKELLKELMFYPEIMEKDNFIYAFDNNKTDISWRDFIETTNANFITDLKLYESINFESKKSLLSHMEKHEKDNLFIDIYNTDKTLFYKTIKDVVTEERKKEIFKSLYNDKEFLRSIKIYLEENQNKTQAAKLANLHRNSLENRLEKFYQITGYDVRKFVDASYIYLFLKDE